MIQRCWLVIRKAGVVGYLLLTSKISSLSREAKLWRFIRRRLIDSPKTLSFISFRTAVDAICTELQNKKKAVYKYLSISGLEYSWNHCGEEKKKALLGNTATNDKAESTLGGTPLTFSESDELHYQAQEQSVTWNEMLSYGEIRYPQRKIQLSIQMDSFINSLMNCDRQ